MMSVAHAGHALQYILTNRKGFDNLWIVNF